MSCSVSTLPEGAKWIGESKIHVLSCTVQGPSYFLLNAILHVRATQAV